MRPKFFILFFMLFGFIGETIANDTLFIKVHFLYGSKPKREFRHSERKWFGGIMGGHVGIEVDSNKFIDFIPEGNFHLISRKHKRNSRFIIHNLKSFLGIFGDTTGQLKEAIVIIPISPQQKQKLDSIINAYTSETPYDYAFVGMRCGAATYDILGQLGIVKQYSRTKTFRKIFYPKKLRRRLFKKAHENRWRILKREGSRRRIWESD